MTAQYMLLRPHFFNGYIAAGSVITEGIDVPSGWVPTLAVDPLNMDAVNAFFAAGPRSGGIYEDLSLWPVGMITYQPATFWVKASGGLWSLTGLGANIQGIYE